MPVEARRNGVPVSQGVSIQERPPREPQGSRQEASGRVLYHCPWAGALAEPPDPVFSGASGFRGECVIWSTVSLSVCLRRGRERSGSCPGRAAPSSELICADAFLCGVRHEEDGGLSRMGLSPGTRVRAQLLKGGETGSSCCLPGRYAGASGSGQGLVLCLCLCFSRAPCGGFRGYEVRSPEGEGAPLQSPFSFVIYRLPPTNRPGGEEGVKGIPFPSLPCALSARMTPDLTVALSADFGRICDRHDSGRRGG